MLYIIFICLSYGHETLSFFRGLLYKSQMRNNEMINI